MLRCKGSCSFQLNIIADSGLIAVRHHFLCTLCWKPNAYFDITCLCCFRNAREPLGWSYSVWQNRVDFYSISPGKRTKPGRHLFQRNIQGVSLCTLVRWTKARKWALEVAFCSGFFEEKSFLNIIPKFKYLLIQSAQPIYVSTNFPIRGRFGWFQNLVHFSAVALWWHLSCVLVAHGQACYPNSRPK